MQALEHAAIAGDDPRPGSGIAGGRVDPRRCFCGNSREVRPRSDETGAVSGSHQLVQRNERERENKEHHEKSDRAGTDVGVADFDLCDRFPRQRRLAARDHQKMK